MEQFWAFLKKEFWHILRDKRTMLILLVMPVVLIVLFGYAVTTEVKNTRVAVLELAKDEATARAIGHIAANRYFSLSAQADCMADVDDLFRRGEADLAVVFGEDFATGTEQPSVQILADGSEPNQAAVRTGYMQQVLAGCMPAASEKAGHPAQAGGVAIVTRLLYNPQSRSEYNFVPGVIGLILMLICVMMTSISIVREKETGTMEVLLASPLPPACIVLAKLVPYFLVSCLNLATILLLSVSVLHIPVAGSLPGLVGVSLLYILVSLSLGLLISTVVASQLAAMLLSLLTIVPAIYLSGIMFPVESMPQALQYVSAVVPTRWYVEAARRLMIQGVPMAYVAREALVLLLMAVALPCVAWRMFKIRLE